jgi:hypothetical protein
MTRKAATEKSDSEVTISLVDSWTEIFGPPGARGMSETGREIHPPRVNDGHLRDAIQALGREHGLTWKPHHAEREVRVARFDFGSTKDVTDALIAAGGAAASFGFLRGGARLLSDWIKARMSRSATLKFNSTEVTVHGDDNIEKIIEALRKNFPHLAPPMRARKISGAAKVSKDKRRKKPGAAKARPKKVTPKKAKSK